MLVNYIDFGILGPLFLLACALFVKGEPSDPNSLAHLIASEKGMGAMGAVVLWAFCRYMWMNLTSPEWTADATCDIKLASVKNQRNLYLEVCIIVLACASLWISNLYVKLFERRKQ
eukprot:TRINITY_DN49072_c0_g1_i1.p1 TRINITY_DN49072_c0_g1~~TRINITY_DN49072_c0_g1_i1.p1  ORF type:complete len:136 (+),score=30.03 TRINITY_DN49072_c0_g1_i1:61-408(+)